MKHSLSGKQGAAALGGLRLLAMCPRTVRGGEPQPAALRLWGGTISGPEAERLLAQLESQSPQSSAYTSGDDSSEEDGCKGGEGGQQQGGGRVIRKRKRAPPAVQEQTMFISECQLPTNKGLFRLRAYRHMGRKCHEPVVMVAGEWGPGAENVLVRVHDQCQTSEVLGSKRCDCKEQLDASLRHIQQHGGAVIYLAQEGRGIGLANKVAAYALQDRGLDTVDANRQLGFGDDERSYECIPFILEDMGIRSVRLMTNNPFKVESLSALGVDVAGRVEVVVPTNPHNARYIQSKVERMGHLIDGL